METNRIIVYKRCKDHARFKHHDPQALEDICRDCRKAGFRATMRARGITVATPTYGGSWRYQRWGWPGHDDADLLKQWRNGVAAWN